MDLQICESYANPRNWRQNIKVVTPRGVGRLNANFRKTLSLTRSGDSERETNEIIYNRRWRKGWLMSHEPRKEHVPERRSFYQQWQIIERPSKQNIKCVHGILYSKNHFYLWGDQFQWSGKNRRQIPMFGTFECLLNKR